MKRTEWRDFTPPDRDNPGRSRGGFCRVKSEPELAQKVFDLARREDQARLSAPPTNALTITATPGGPVCITFPTDPTVGAADIAAMAAAMIEDLQRLAEPPVAENSAASADITPPSPPRASAFASKLSPRRVGE